MLKGVISEGHLLLCRSIASRLAPTGDLWRSQIRCGSQPAGDGACTGPTLSGQIKPSCTADCLPS
ncbi:hypothetical protein DLD99_02770 [Pseudomonas kribbensis]|uniref:Uncharacterized protein n=1 Tax=Pseudomonas kribbensis TaxID=1628086 RepID=A0A345RJG7_9PSED|nr:hypothetical protein DLD99_02770 [Pseudomonas kribbensis]